VTVTVIMKHLNVLVLVSDFKSATQSADKESMHFIRSVSPRINVRDGARLAAAEHAGDCSNRKKLDALLAWADVIYCLRAPKNTIARAPKLQWIQVISAGVDRWIGTDVWQSRVTLTGVSGIHATPIGEFVMMLMLMFAKNSLLGFKMMQSRRWQRYRPGTLHDKTVGIVGLGHIGREVARLSKAFGMRTIATRRSSKKPGTARHVDLLLPRNHLKKMLAVSDFVVVCVPLTPETHHIIGKSELDTMRSSAVLINIGRGHLIDEKALLNAREKKQIAGAGLDVTYTEPLPKDSALWGLDNVILSPHISGDMEDYMLRATDVFCENLRRYLDGKKLLNVVNRKKGY
jgi:phosphoglycerate dehydrogenase-like enzyme